MTFFLGLGLVVSMMKDMMLWSEKALSNTEMS